MALTLTFTVQGDNNVYTFDNVVDFRQSRYADSLLDYAIGDELKVPVDIVHNQIVHIPAIEGIEERWYTSNLRTRLERGAVVYSDIMDRWILREYAYPINGDDDWASQRFVRESGEVVRVENHGHWISTHPDIRQTIHGCYMFVDECEQVDGRWQRVGYVRPQAEGADYFGGYFSNQGTEEFLHPESLANIGIEIEKSRIYFRGNHIRQGSYVGVHRAVCRVVHDGSLPSGGGEIVSNVWGADPECWDDVLEMLDSEHMPEFANSPVQLTGARQCGGHVSLSYRGLGKMELARKLRPFLPIIMSMYRERLKHHYSNGNSVCDWSRGGRGGRGMLNLNRNNDSIEVRLPDGVRDLADLKFRYKLFAKALQLCVVSGLTDTKLIWAELAPIMQEYYGEDYEDKTRFIEPFTSVLQSTELGNQAVIPEVAEPYFAHYISQERRRVIMEAQRAEAARLRLETEDAIIAGLRSTRRRARTNVIGSTFTVHCTIDGQRRSRTIHITRQGLTYNRGCLLHGINPNDVHGLTITTTDGELVTFEENRRAGEVINYTTHCNTSRQPMYRRLNSSTYYNTNITNGVLVSQYWRNAEVYSYVEGDIVWRLYTSYDYRTSTRRAVVQTLVVGDTGNTNWVESPHTLEEMETLEMNHNAILI